VAASPRPFASEGLRRREAVGVVGQQECSASRLVLLLACPAISGMRLREGNDVPNPALNALPLRSRPGVLVTRMAARLFSSAKAATISPR